MYLTLWETAKLHNFAFPQEMQRSSSSFISFPKFGVASSFNCNHSIGYTTVVSHYYFNLANDIEHLFLFLGHLYILCFVTCLIKSLSVLKIELLNFLLLYVEFLHIYLFWAQALCYWSVFQIFLPIYDPPFNFLHAVFEEQSFYFSWGSI